MKYCEFVELNCELNSQVILVVFLVEWDAKEHRLPLHDILTNARTISPSEQQDVSMENREAVNKVNK